MVVALAGRRIDAPGAERPRFPLANVEAVAERLRRANLDALTIVLTVGALLLGGFIHIAQRPRRRSSSIATIHPTSSLRPSLASQISRRLRAVDSGSQGSRTFAKASDSTSEAAC
jgi:hypothetical protein